MSGLLVSETVGLLVIVKVTADVHCGIMMYFELCVNGCSIQTVMVLLAASSFSLLCLVVYQAMIRSYSSIAFMYEHE